MFTPPKRQSRVFGRRKNSWRKRGDGESKAPRRERGLNDGKWRRGGEIYPSEGFIRKRATARRWRIQKIIKDKIIQGESRSYQAKEIPEKYEIWGGEKQAHVRAL